ncbi:MAG: cysteine hydrolase [Bacillota bacterium]|nr:cysteine hydrolase [Bacillota bacterium]
MKALIVVDMQNDFVTGNLGTPEARDIVLKIKTKIKNYIENNPSTDQVVFTQDSHSIYGWNNPEKIEMKNVPPHCIDGTPGWCIVDELFPFVNEIIVKNNFGYLNWETFFIDNNYSYKRLPPTSIEIVGVCTDICVISNALALRAIFPKAQIIVDASCCAGTTPEKHKAALEVMKSCCIEVINE